MKITRQKRTALLSLLMLALPIAVTVGLTTLAVYQYRRQARLDHALITAVNSGDAKSAVSLLQHGADANATDHPAVSEGAWTILLRLFRPRPPSAHFPTALHIALSNRAQDPGPYTDILNALLQHRADVNLPDAEGITPLMLALQDDTPGNSNAPEDIVNVMLSHTPNLRVKDKYSNTPLVYAIHSGNIALVRRLLDAGASVDDRIGEYDAPMTFAVFSVGTGTGRVQPLAMVDLLLDHGVDVNARDGNGKTLLISAAELADDKLLGDMLKRGAKVNAKNNDGWTALSGVQDALKNKDNDPYYSFVALKHVESMLKAAGAKQ